MASSNEPLPGCTRYDLGSGMSPVASMSDTVKLILGAVFLGWLAWEFRHWFRGSWSVRRGLLFRIGGAALGALAPGSAIVGIPIGYVAGILVSLAYNLHYDD